MKININKKLKKKIIINLSKKKQNQIIKKFLIIKI